MCSLLETIARTRDDKGHNWDLLVEFDDLDGAKKRGNILARTSGLLKRYLLWSGMKSHFQRLNAEYINWTEPSCS